MKTVAIYGEKNTLCTGAVFAELLNTAGVPFLYVADGTVRSACGRDTTPRLLLVEGDDMERFPSCVLDFLILEENLPASAGTIRSLPACALACSGAAPAVKKLSRYASGQVISCGFCSADTLTYASTGEGNPVVSVQRSFLTIDGKRIETQDIPLTFQSDSSPDYSLLAAAAALLCLGEESLLPASF